jgi:hypothetical protein
MNSVAIGSGDGLSLSIGILLGYMEGFPYRDSEGKGIVRDESFLLEPEDIKNVSLEPSGTLVR